MSADTSEKPQSTGNAPTEYTSGKILLTEEFEKIVLDALKEWNVPGVSIAIVDNGKIFSKVLYFSPRRE